LRDGNLGTGAGRTSRIATCGNVGQSNVGVGGNVAPPVEIQAVASVEAIDVLDIRQKLEIVGGRKVEGVRGIRRRNSVDGVPDGDIPSATSSGELELTKEIDQILPGVGKHDSVVVQGSAVDRVNRVKLNKICASSPRRRLCGRGKDRRKVTQIYDLRIGDQIFNVVTPSSGSLGQRGRELVFLWRHRSGVEDL